MCSPKRYNIKKILMSISSDNSGAVAVIIGICLFALMIATALAVDVGSLFEDRRHLQTVADSAALAGAQELPENPGEAVSKAIEYAASHGVSIDVGDVQISRTWVEKDTITVTAVNPDSPLYFARVMDEESTKVGARATAIIASPKEVSNIVPWGVPEDKLKYDEETVLKYGSAPESPGNFQALGIDRVDDKGKIKTQGGDVYKDNIEFGSNTLLKIEDMVDTQTGNLVGPTRQGTENRIYNYHNTVFDNFGVLAGSYAGGNCLLVPDSQFIIVPVIESLVDVHGHSEVKILNFACFIITEIQDMHNDPEYGNGIAIVGRFLNMAIVNTDGSVTAVQPSGLRVIRLIK